MAQALQLTESIDLDYRLTTEICELWGRTFSVSETREQLKATRDTLRVLKAMHTTIRGLKRAGLYLSVPREAQVGGVLHRTNVLTHDPHYRHLAALWDNLQNLRKNARKAPSDVLSARQHFEQQYSDYVGLVLTQALCAIGLKTPDSGQWAGHDLAIRRTGYDWKILVDGQLRLTLVPWAYLQALPEGDLPLPGSGRLVCWPGVERDAVLDLAQAGMALQVSPLDLYVVERMAGCIAGLLTKVLLSGFGKTCRAASRVS